MELKLLSPTYVLLPHDGEDVKRFLTYDNHQVKFQINKLKKQFRYGKGESDWFKNRLAELTAEIKTTLIWYNEDGLPYTLAGLIPELQTRFKWGFTPTFVEMAGRPFPYAVQPEFTNRYYQDDAVKAMIDYVQATGLPCNIELPTGAGKSAIVRDLAKHEPVETVIFTPSASISNQLFEELQTLFGKKWVGMYGDGKKDYKKLITVAVVQSLVKLQPGTPAYEKFKKTKKIIADESHTIAAETLSEMMKGLFEHVEQRYFVSATQMRTDGSGLLLDGIIGKKVYKKSFRELVEEGFLAKPIFKTFTVPTHGSAGNNDAKAETREQLYGNPHVNRMAADIATKMVLAGKQVVVLLEEFRQFSVFKNYLGTNFTFVHGGASKDAKEFLEPEFWDCDSTQAVKDFNAGKIRLLIGTSAIATGTDTRPVDCLIYLQGGTSEIKVKQAIGRGTRITPTKKSFFAIDFKVEGSKTMERHYGIRKGIYEELGDVFEKAA